MTITYDPKHPKYLDEADVRDELTRVYDLCHGCRLCFKFCTSFPTLFEMIDRHDDQDAGRLTPAQQDQVIDECFQCKLCYVNCPYIPELHEWALDFPRLMLRADAMRHANGRSPSAPPTGWAAPTWAAATIAAPSPTRLGAKPGSLAKAMEKYGGRPCACCRPTPPAVRRFRAPEVRLRSVRQGGRVPHMPRRVPEPGGPPTW
jgi:ferredoxin